MIYTLYNRPGSGGFVVEAALTLAGAPFELIEDALRSAAIRRMREALALIDTHVEGPFLLGEEMTVADIYIAMFFVWHRGDIEVPRLARIAEAVRDHPVVGPIWRRHFGER